MAVDQGDITQLLIRWREGDRPALYQMLPFVRRELDQLARRHLARERKGHTMQPCSLIQEVFLRLLQGSDISWQNRAHFYAVASQVMRRVLVEYARAHNRIKAQRGSDGHRRGSSSVGVAGGRYRSN